jgi:hypothetical protein
MHLGMNYPGFLGFRNGFGLGLSRCAMKAIRESRTACCIGSLGVGYIGIVSAQAVHPSHDEAVACPEHVEQAPLSWAVP